MLYCKSTMNVGNSTGCINVINSICSCGDWGLRNRLVVQGMGQGRNYRPKQAAAPQSNMFLYFTTRDPCSCKFT